MTCARYRQLISRYMDGEVTPRQRRELLEHVEGCHECAAWLARARQTDVLLKGAASEPRPSDRVRETILSSVKRHESPTPTRPIQAPGHLHSALRTPHSAFRRWSLLAAGLLLRFDPSPKRVALSAATSIFAVIGLAYWLNILPPIGGYKELGFLVPGEEAPAAVNATPLAAISSGKYGVGGPVAIPNPVRLSPTGDARDVPLGAPLSIRFDQPMDRASVENAWDIDPPAAGLFRWAADNELRFSPQEPGLLRGITYTVLLSTTARSLTGTPLRQPVKWSFRTKEPYGVMPGTTPGAALSPTDALSLNFETPMNREQTTLSLHADGSGEELPVTLDWDAGGRKVIVSPDMPMPEGTVYLRAGAMSRTQGGDTLGQPHEFAYTVALPTSRVRLLDGRINVAIKGRPGSVRYEVSADEAHALPTNGYIPDEDASPGPIVTFSLYNLPAEYISALGAQKRPWPMSLPGGLPGELAPVQIFSASPPDVNRREDAAHVPDTLPAGTYLLRASTLAEREIITDWQMLVVADHHIVSTTDRGGPSFWATDAQGHAWAGSEVSLYSPEGTLLEKGLTNERGLWSPDMPTANATLAIARDGAGHLAAMTLDVQTTIVTQSTDTLSATLCTDRAEYYPGQAVNFRVLLHPAPEAIAATPLAEQEAEVSLRTPAGNMLESLTLKPDDVGGASGSFSLPGDLRPGEYDLLVRADREERSFPLNVKQPKSDTLSVYIVPGAPEDETARVITRTVSVLGPNGAAASGAALTMTLGITGDSWVSEPVTATTNSEGKAIVAITLPAWIASYNEPSLYLEAVSTMKGMSGSDGQYLDLTSVGVARAGMRQMVSPALNLAAVARTSKDGSINVRIVTLDGKGVGGDVLLTAYSPSGAQQSWSLDLSSAGDITMPLPRNYAGGRLRLLRAGVAGSRELALMPQVGGGLALQVSAPPSAAPDAPVAMRLSLVDKEGAGVAGVASIWFRRVAGSDTGDAGGESLGWEPDVTLSASGTVSATVQAPGTPGLWYVLSEAATGDGGYVQAWSVMRVLPGPSIQGPPTVQVQSMNPQTVSVVAHNPSDGDISVNMRVEGHDALRTSGSDSQMLSLAAGGSRRVDWRLQASRPGAHLATFSFAPGREATGAWNLPVVAAKSERTNTTYVSGVTTSERAVGVLVPSGLAADRVELQVRASSSLLPTLSSIASNIASDSPSKYERALAAAARLSASAAVAWAYTEVGAQIPDTLSISAGESAHLLEQIYAAQNGDGSWSAEEATGETPPGSITSTSNILLALRQYSLASPEQDQGSDSYPDVEMGLIERGLTYLSTELTRPVGDHAATSRLDARAYGLYALSSYGVLQPELARPYLAYASPEGGLSHAGQAWLALALMQSGSTQDGLVLLDRLLNDPTRVTVEVAAPVLDALLVADKATLQAKPLSQAKESSAYISAAPAYVRLLMESRQGVGWATYGETSDAMSALSRYAAQTGEKVLKGIPTLTLNDRPVHAPPDGNSGSTISLVIPGNELHAGTNWLRLKAPTPGQPLYYSLTLRATR
ncbi:MAG TPA: Ig-like domain-containing protein [Chloroflexia bacterium]|nr:Ig-like domain-containing protein [Chloroflexia bacterium]